MKLFSPTLLGFSALAGLAVSKFSNITPEYLQELKGVWGEDSTESQIANAVDSFYSFTGLYNVQVMEILPRFHGFEESMDLVNSLLTYGIGTYIFFIILFNFGGALKFLFNKYTLIFASLATLFLAHVTPLVFAIIFTVTLIMILSLRKSTVATSTIK